MTPPLILQYWQVLFFCFLFFLEFCFIVIFFVCFSPPHLGWVCLPLPNPLTSSSWLSWLLLPIVLPLVWVARPWQIPSQLRFTSAVVGSGSVSLPGLWHRPAFSRRDTIIAQSNANTTVLTDHSAGFITVSFTRQMHKSLPDQTASPRCRLRFSSPPSFGPVSHAPYSLFNLAPSFPHSIRQSASLVPWDRRPSFMFCPGLPLWSKRRRVYWHEREKGSI